MDQNNQNEQNNNNIFNNPLFQNMTPEKLEFLMNFQNMEKPKDTSSAAPFINETMNQAKKDGVNFSKDESTMIMEMLMQNMPEADRKKAEMLMMFMRGKK